MEIFQPPISLGISPLSHFKSASSKSSAKGDAASDAYRSGRKINNYVDDVGEVLSEGKKNSSKGRKLVDKLKDKVRKVKNKVTPKKKNGVGVVGVPKSGKVVESGKTTGQASKADFIVTPKGTVMDTSMDYNLVSTTTPTNQGGEFFQIHNSHPHKGNTPHTHKQQVNTNPVTGVSSSKRIDNPTTAVDIDYADSVLRSGTMRIRINIDDVGGY